MPIDPVIVPPSKKRPKEDSSAQGEPLSEFERKQAEQRARDYLRQRIEKALNIRLLSTVSPADIGRLLADLPEIAPEDRENAAILGIKVAEEPPEAVAPAPAEGVEEVKPPEPAERPRFRTPQDVLEQAKRASPVEERTSVVPRPELQPAKVGEEVSEEQRKERLRREIEETAVEAQRRREARGAAEPGAAVAMERTTLEDVEKAIEKKRELIAERKEEAVEPVSRGTAVPIAETKVIPREARPSPLSLRAGVSKPEFIVVQDRKQAGRRNPILPNAEKAFANYGAVRRDGQVDWEKIRANEQLRRDVKSALAAACYANHAKEKIAGALGERVRSFPHNRQLIAITRGDEVDNAIESVANRVGGRLGNLQQELIERGFTPLEAKKEALHRIVEGVKRGRYNATFQRQLSKLLEAREAETAMELRETPEVTQKRLLRLHDTVQELTDAVQQQLHRLIREDLEGKEGGTRVLTDTGVEVNFDKEGLAVTERRLNKRTKREEVAGPVLYQYKNDSPEHYKQQLEKALRAEGISDVAKYTAAAGGLQEKLLTDFLQNPVAWSDAQARFQLTEAAKKVGLGKPTGLILGTDETSKWIRDHFGPTVAQDLATDQIRRIVFRTLGYYGRDDQILTNRSLKGLNLLTNWTNAGLHELGKNAFGKRSLLAKVTNPFDKKGRRKNKGILSLLAAAAALGISGAWKGLNTIPAVRSLNARISNWATNLNTSTSTVGRAGRGLVGLYRMVRISGHFAKAGIKGVSSAALPGVLAYAGAGPFAGGAVGLSWAANTFVDDILANENLGDQLKYIGAADWWEAIQNRFTILDDVHSFRYSNGLGGSIKGLRTGSVAGSLAYLGALIFGANPLLATGIGLAAGGTAFAAQVVWSCELNPAIKRLFLQAAKNFKAVGALTAAGQISAAFPLLDALGVAFSYNYTVDRIKELALEGKFPGLFKGYHVWLPGGLREYYWARAILRGETEFRLADIQMFGFFSSVYGVSTFSGIIAGALGATAMSGFVTFPLALISSFIGGIVRGPVGAAVTSLTSMIGLGLGFVIGGPIGAGIGYILGIGAGLLFTPSLTSLLQRLGLLGVSVVGGALGAISSLLEFISTADPQKAIEALIKAAFTVAMASMVGGTVLMAAAFYAPTGTQMDSAQLGEPQFSPHVKLDEIDKELIAIENDGKRLRYSLKYRAISLGENEAIQILMYDEIQNLSASDVDINSVHFENTSDIGFPGVDFVGDEGGKLVVRTSTDTGPTGDNPAPQIDYDMMEKHGRNYKAELVIDLKRPLSEILGDKAICNTFMVQTIPYEGGRVSGETGNASIKRCYDKDGEQVSDSGSLVCPVDGSPVLTSDFGKRLNPEPVYKGCVAGCLDQGGSQDSCESQCLYTFHAGIDIGVDKVPVFAVRSGTVVTATEFKKAGKVIEIEFEDDICGGTCVAAYMHLDEMNVSVGQTVSQKQQIGISGASGDYVTGPHLDFRIRRKSDGKPIDPMEVLPPGCVQT